jgi:tRNA threonylcarbamoyladenosine biosynthesis protein TsaE
MQVTIETAAQMEKLGAALGKTAEPGSLLLLTGDLGAGKTTLTKELLAALGIRRPGEKPDFHDRARIS